ncbi:hypothetical protein GUJ93_ZPchr0003g17106, partial [Zizania palustris]
WLVDEIRESAPKELDFLNEAKNSEKCLLNFRRLSPHIADSIYAPKVYWNLSSSRILTMEFMDAKEITDVNGIKELGIRPVDVSNLVSKAFAEMIFKHGFVHCDPHAANLMIRPLPQDSKKTFGWRKPQLILLDHGLYKELDYATRISYASLWKALVFADAKAIKENSVKLGAGEDLHALFAGVLTMRPWKRVIDPSVDHLVLDGNNTDRSEVQMYASLYFSEISELLRRLPRVILLMLKTNDCLRAVNHVLVGGSSMESFVIIGRVSSEAVLEAKKMAMRSFLNKLYAWYHEKKRGRRRPRVTKNRTDATPVGRTRAEDGDEATFNALALPMASFGCTALHCGETAARRAGGGKRTSKCVYGWPARAHACASWEGCPAGGKVVAKVS